MKRAQYMDFAQEKAAQNKDFVELSVEYMLERKIEHAIRNELEKLGFDVSEASHEARWYASSLKELGHIGVTSDKMLAIYAGNNYSDDELIDEDVSL